MVRELHRKRPLDLITAAGVVCPVCHGALVTIPQGGVGCGGCGRMYPVRDGLPVLIAAEATLPEKLDF